MNISNEISSVGIIGCGWLGTALAIKLLAQKVDVLATRSSLENVELLREIGIPSQVLLLPEEVECLVNKSIFEQQCIVIAITPQFRQGRFDYADKVIQIVNAAKQKKQVQRIILLSSSAVYNGLVGEVNEASSLDLSSEKVQVLHDAEKAVLAFLDESGSKKGYVLRLAGLIGPSRHPGKFIANGRMLNSPEAPVNLIHQEDAQGLVSALLSTNEPSGIFNGVSQTHVTKKIYYQVAAKALSLPVPKFIDNSGVTSARIVSGEKAKKTLSYQFVYPDLLTWL